ncbi:hypothetical protein MHN80_23480 [Gordonia McavH-238-E]|uniref:hypothetical protein n=1 Tax=Gordonia sp. McavH-238-E TaxID=2917736 RepID=UPI001EF5A2B8|nr:hypothetical protein [Gordonia sp. McavH-238-E]MCG7635282.1 hypothetical protein [Gordonia sp. McavH-238-E]
MTPFDDTENSSRDAQFSGRGSLSEAGPNTKIHEHGFARDRRRELRDIHLENTRNLR